MKQILGVIFSALLAIRLWAQTNEAVAQLAIVNESPEVAAAADLLSARLSRIDQVQLLERAEIEKVIREQQISLNNLDCLKLGQLLGADGLLALQSFTEGTNEFISVQLVAVRQGVVLEDERIGQPTADAAGWSDAIVHHLEPLLPKLNVLPQDAIPLSVVNFHAGVRTAEAADLERQIFSLTVERLVRERRIFVLERRRMRTLSEEKEMAGAKAEPFWNGKYLLDGTIDRNGFNPGVVAISARLIPPGGNPVLIEASGSRTNYVQVVNQLADKVMAEFKLESGPSAWNTADEAAKFFQEAKWNLSWGLLPQAQAAVDSAWALGKHDEDCATVAIHAHLADITRNLPGYNHSEHTFSAPRNADGKPIGPGFSDEYVQQDINKMVSEHKFGIAFKKRTEVGTKVVAYVHANGPPNEENLNRARHALERYLDFSRALYPAGGRAYAELQSSGWYQLGVENLNAASETLKGFNLAPELRVADAEKISQLRDLARMVAAWIASSPGVQASYFVGDRIATHDELAQSIEEPPNIFRCQLHWGGFWQERPEDTVTLYDKLMSSPVFCYIHKDLWNRDPLEPRLVAWDEEDQKRIPAIWKGFTNELAASTNLLLRMEAKALVWSDTDDDQQKKNAYEDLRSLIRSNRNELVANKVELAYSDWGLTHPDPDLEVTPFEAQKQYLKANTPYDPQAFVQMFIFGFKDYSREQAQEIKPLLAEYKKQLPGTWPPTGQMQVAQVEANVERILNPAAVISPSPNRIAMTNSNRTRPLDGNFPPGRQPWLGQPGTPPQFAQNHFPPGRATEGAAETPAPEPLVSSNLVTVNNFYPLPMDGLPGDKPHTFRFTDHQLVEGKLLLDFQYDAWVYSLDQSGNWQSSASKTYSGVAQFDPVSSRWQVAVLPGFFTIETGNRFSHHSTLWRGALYSSNSGKVQKFDWQGNTWDSNALPVSGNCQLYNLAGKLYVADYNSIQQITDDARGTKLLTSIQRQPPVTRLDSQGALMNLALFTNAADIVCAAVHNKVFRWDGVDWGEIGEAPASFQPSVFERGVLFLTDGWNQRPARISCLNTESSRVELCLGLPDHQRINAPSSNSNDSAKPLWRLPVELSLPNLSAALWQSDLFLMADHSEKKDIVDEQQHLIIGEKFLAKDGYDSALYRFSHGRVAAGKFLLKFDDSKGCPPMAGLGSNSQPLIPQMGLVKPWMLFMPNYLLCGRERWGDVPGSSEPAGFTPGIWAVPLDSIVPKITASTQTQSRQTLQ